MNRQVLELDLFLVLFHLLKPYFIYVKLPYGQILYQHSFQFDSVPYLVKVLTDSSLRANQRTQRLAQIHTTIYYVCTTSVIIYRNNWKISFVILAQHNGIHTNYRLLLF